MKWPVLPLARICRIEIGRTPSRAHPEYFGGDNVWVTIADLNDGTVCESKEHVTDDAVSKARMRPVPVGTVLLSYKLSLGKLGIAGTNLFTNEAIAALPSRPGVEIVAKYLFYALRTVDYLALCHGAVKGKCLNRASLNRIPVPLPPLSEQQRIVEILDQADALRKKRAEADAKAARILPALFYKMFGDPATNPKGWRVAPISEMIDPIERKDPSSKPDDPFIYIDIAGVNGQLGIITEAKEMMGADAPSRARQVIRMNDVIISTVRPYLRATALVPAEYDNQICSTGFCVLRAKGGVGHGFLYALSRLQWFTEQLNARARGASYPAVTDADVFNLHVPQPADQGALKTLDRQVLDVLILQDKRRSMAASIESLFETLLHRAFSGDLTAKWREAHMKELLQEMEQQAKALNLRIES